ncbi:MAG: cytochrome d ubiquinol oxidase subunit II [Pseudomonadota bacterium]
MEFFSDPERYLPFIFASLMGVSILIYVILDGFDLGVGILLPLATDEEKDIMVSSIGPFWDANETWLVLAIGLLLVAFPVAHGEILGALYLPATIMLIGLILRGVAFEFRVKAPPQYKNGWNWAFFAGSLITALCQGAMLGIYIMGLEYTLWTIGFAALCAGAITVGYSMIGGTWLAMKTVGDLQVKAIDWSKRGLFGALVGIGLVSIATPLVSPRIFDKWFTLPELFYLAPIPLITAALTVALWFAIKRLEDDPRNKPGQPFYMSMGLFALSYIGLAYSFYPYVVPEKMTIYDAASATESLWIILVGTIFVLPTILGYTALAYYVFRGKAKQLTYY